jgi:phage-related protein
MKDSIEVNFFKTEYGNEPVREWLKSLDIEERQIIGQDLKTVQFGWPIGMPFVKKIDQDIWELRSVVANKQARVLFVLIDDIIFLLHGFVKKTNKIPKSDIALANKRAFQLKESLK